MVLDLCCYTPNDEGGGEYTCAVTVMMSGDGETTVRIVVDDKTFEFTDNEWGDVVRTVERSLKHILGA